MVPNFLLDSEKQIISSRFTFDCLNISGCGNPLGCSRLREGSPAGDLEAAAASHGEGEKGGRPVLRQHPGAAHPQRGSGDAGKALRQPR